MKRKLRRSKRRNRSRRRIKRKGNLMMKTDGGRITL